MDIRIVYEASPGADLTAVARVLEAAGCHPVTPDDPSPSADLDYVTAGTLTVRVAVPAVEEEAARAALERWDRETGGGRGPPNSASRRFTLWFLLAVAVAGLAAFLLTR